ncbi:membrane protein [Deinococcus reticulitermitis]|uniref:Membrane protein n=1 Tax=Deinococcus reticulitermitis TaxID=856736 RepID=A0A1H7A016_9DEIO|nr:YihY/virulence factor BrkB family protein [Deinococcus reticulitermitis]SEJ58808.1 membrane protein [Deinococcus reticulitermitis]
MKLKPADLFTLIREAALAFGQDKAPRLAAAISYYAISSLAPLLLVAVAVAGFFLTNDAVVDRLFGPEGTVAQSLGEQAATTLRQVVENQDGLQRGSIIASVIAFVVTFMGATGLFVQLQDALNSMWGADPGPPQGIVNIVKTRVVSFLLILGIGLVLLLFLALNTWLSALAQTLGDSIGVGALFVRLGTFALSAVLLTPVFGAIFKFLPSIKLQWREVLVGGAITAFLFSIGQILIGIYFGRAAPGSAFGAAGTLVALLAWIYYSAMIFFFGAEATWVYSQKFGTRAGGAANPAKKAALAQRGAALDSEPSDQEAAAQAEAGRKGQPARDSRGRVIGTGSGRSRARTRAGSPALQTDGRLLPSLGGAVWNAVAALLALPAVLVLRVFGLTGRRR